MELLLSILSYQNTPLKDDIAIFHFSELGGTIGRGPSNAVVLRDPEQYISRIHARVDCRRDAFFLFVMGKNAAELNGRPIEQGEEAKLNDGDEIKIGDYVLEAKVVTGGLTGEPASESVDHVSGLLNSSSRVTEPIRPHTESKTAFGVSLFGGGLRDTTKRENQIQRAAASESNHLPIINEPVPPIRSMKNNTLAALDQWDPFASDDEEESSADVAVQAPKQANVHMNNGAETRVQHVANGDAPVLVDAPDHAVRQPARLAEVQCLVEAEKPVVAVNHAFAPERNRFLDASTVATAQAEGQPSTTGAADVIRSLLRAAGVPEIERRALNDPDMMRGVGEILKEAVDGLHRVLRGRAVTKREMRVDQTMMEASGNNPLKFTPEAKDALSYLLAPRGDTGFMPPVKAVREAFDDIQAHNLAVVAGVRAALRSVFMRFDPAQIESRLKSQGFLDRVVPMNRKARMWDLMSELHALTVKEAQGDFDRLFGQTFAKAYQEELLRQRVGGKHFNQ